MRNKLTTVMLIVFLSGTSMAQIQLPQPSPTASFSQSVGLTEVEILYSRPSMKGREIYGGLVPYDALWRTGANMATKVTFGDDVNVGGKDLKAGTYGLFSIPGENEWTIIFNTNWNQGGTGQYKEDEDAVRFTVKSEKFPYTVETFTIIIGNVTNTAASINIVWENTIVKIPLKVDIDTQIMASIDQALQVNPNSYYQAALYYRESGRDLNQALEWMDKALAAQEAEDRNVFWMYRQKALLLADMKKYDDAITTAKKSLAQATTAKNNDYIRMNEDSIAEWTKLK